MKYLPSGIRLTWADALTLIGLFLSIVATFFLFRGMFFESYVLILFQIILDFFDGRVARKRKSEHKLGAELDSFSDFYTIVNAALFGFFSGFDHPLTIIILTFFIIAGALRLSIFSVVGTEGGYYRGVPTTLTSLIMTTLIMANIWFIEIDTNWFLWGYVIFSVLMPSGIRVKKI
jgi:CDP-diacylglycerol--serine O-phosphatidyltransferase